MKAGRIFHRFICTFLKRHPWGRILPSLIIIILFASDSASSGKQDSIKIYAPATPTSIPLILAAQNLPGTRVHIFVNHSQAHCLFLRNEISILSTGLSVGVSFYRQQVPVVILNSYVSGLTYLVARKKKVSAFKDLKGEKIYLPFPGSPVEETTRYFIEQEKLRWKEDVQIGYADPDTAAQLLQHGRIAAAALPEPFAGLAARVPGIHVSLNYMALWARHTGVGTGYPQIGLFAKRDWAENNSFYIQRLNHELTKAVEWISSFPEAACEKARPYFQFSEDILCSAIRNVAFRSLNSDQLKNEIKNYYQTIGNPLDEGFNEFFYTGPQ